jgi:uncharacterized protein (TIGR03435 family)
MKTRGLIRVHLCVFVATLVFVASAESQTFEVASVKPSKSGNNGFSGGCHGIDSVYGSSESASAPPLGRCVIHDARLSHLITMAYEISNMSATLKSEKAPDWVAMGQERFDVDAKAEDSSKTTRAQLLSMLQALLVERFQLKFHYEDKEVQGFILTIAKGGPKFQESKKDDTEPRVNAALKVPEGQPQTINAHKGTMGDLVDGLQFATQAKVIDRTGLMGSYDFKLRFGGENGAEIFTALPQQLGLRLEGAKVTESFFVVDSAKRPTEN